MNMWVEKYLSKAWFPYLLIGLITLLVWGQTVRFGFVWDDHMFITKNKSVRSLRTIPEMFYSSDAQASETAEVFRPLRTAHFAILNAITRKALPQPWIFHLANVLWHTAAAMLLFSVARLLWERQTGVVSTSTRAVALLVSIGFAVHPVTSEVVCWAKSLDDIMAAVFVLAATRSLLKWKEGHNGCFPALVFYLLAVYSKESAVPFALLVFFIAYGFHKLPLRRSIALTAPFLLVAMVYTVHRHLVLGHSSQGAPLSGTYGQTLIDMFPVVTKYARLFWGVPPFCIDYSYLQGHLRFISSEVLAGAILLLVYVGITVWSLQRQAYWQAGFGLLWIGVFLIPVSNLVPMMQYMAERFLYLPLIGFLLALGALLLNGSRPAIASRSDRAFRPWLANTIATVWLLVWALLSWNRSEIWQDELTLFVRSSLQNPRSHRVEKNALVAIFRLSHMRELFPDYRETGTLRMADSISPEKAGPIIETLKEARRIFPDNNLVSTTLGFAYAKSGQLPEAVPLFELAARQMPKEPQCWINLAVVLRDNNDGEKARDACETALRLAPTNLDALRLEVKLCSALEDFPNALEYAKKLQKLEPQNRELQNRIDEIEKKLEAANPKPNPK